MQRVKLLQIQGHYLTLTFKGSILTLEIEQESSGRAFSLDLEEDSIDWATDGLFQTSEGLFRALQDAGNTPGITLSISKGDLTYSAIFYTEPMQRRRFTLNLTEKTRDQAEDRSQPLEKSKEEHKDEVLEDQEDRRQREKEIKENKNIIEKRLSVNVKAPVLLKPDISFNKSSIYASKFALGNKNKTATSLVGNSYCLEIIPEVPPSGQHCYSLRINHTARNQIRFGITTETGTVYWNDNRYNYRYWTPDGKIYGKASSDPIGNGPFGGQGVVIRMVVDMDEGRLTFFVDDQQVNSCEISKSERYHAYISLVDAEDSVTLL